MFLLILPSTIRASPLQLEKVKTFPPVHLGASLKTYRLGLISDINDMLQDVQGKKNTNIKEIAKLPMSEFVTT